MKMMMMISLEDQRITHRHLIFEFMFYSICINLFISNTFKLYNFMDLFELGYYLYKLIFFPCEVNSYEFTIRVYWAFTSLRKLSSLTTLVSVTR